MKNEKRPVRGLLYNMKNMTRHKDMGVRRVMALLVLVMVCVGAHATFEQIQRITLTWPFSAGDVSVLWNYNITNESTGNGVPVYTKGNNDILLLTTPLQTGDAVTAMSNGLTIGGAVDVSSYLNGINEGTNFTKLIVNSNTSGTETIDLVISPNYPGYDILEDTVSFMAFKKSTRDSGEDDIQIGVYPLWGRDGGDNIEENYIPLKEMPTSEQLTVDNYKFSVSPYGWLNDSNNNGWGEVVNADYYGYTVSVGNIYRLRLSIENLQEGDEIYIGNVSVIFRVSEDASNPTSTATDAYLTTYNYDDGIGIEPIVHKASYLYQDDIRYQEGFEFKDDFDEENMMDTLENGVAVQATHVYVDTIYMKKGTSIDLEIPGVKPAWGSTTGEPDECAITNYFRWFNYRNDKNFYCGDDNVIGTVNDRRLDLLIPAYNADNTTAWRFGNGYVSGILKEKKVLALVTDESNIYTLRKVSFYYPTDVEYETVGSNLGQSDNKYYSVACDLSNYTDFSNDKIVVNSGGTAFGLTEDATSDDEEKPQIYCEPTLMQRVLFYIVGIDDDTDKESLPEDFKQYGNLISDESYHGGGNTGDEKYLEEYEITFPSRHISNHTDDLVALSKDAQAYALPVENDPTASYLNISFADNDNSNSFSLSSSTISGANRVIQFYKGTSGAQWSVDNNSTATILVTKTVLGETYNIARFKLTFKDFAIPLTEPQVALLDSIKMDSIKGMDKDKYWWKDMTYRAKSAINENYELVNSLWFDYGSYDNDYNSLGIFANAAGSNASWAGFSYLYPFPLKWSNSSYAFYNGTHDLTYYQNYGNDKYPINGVSDAYNDQIQFCTYGIVNAYLGYGDLQTNETKSPQCTDSVKNHRGSWLYVDASDRPGTVAELNFDEKLCQGSEVIATAWIKSAGTSDNLNDDAAVMFTIMGVTKNDDGTETHTPIYRQYSGQIRTTTYLSAFEDEKDLETQYTGKGTGTNEWFQLYMSFVNSEDVDYDYYTVRIDNCCASTEGGDFYLDEISVYIVHPTVEVAQISPVCTTDETTKGYAPIRLDIDYESIMACFGLYSNDYNDEAEESDDGGESSGASQVSKRRANSGIALLEDDPEEDETETNDSIKSIDFIIVNKYKYNTYLAKSEETDSVAAVKYAIENSIDTLYYKVITTTTDEDTQEEVKDTTLVWSAYPTLSFYLQYAKNTAYVDDTAGENYPYDSLLYRRTDSDTGAELLAADFYSDISAYTPYMIVLRLASEDETDADKLDAFANLLATSYNCAVKSDFSVTSTTKIRVNGEIVDPTGTLCMYETVHIEPQGTYTTTETIDGEDVEVSHTIEGECFDWFVGTEDEYVAVNDTLGVSLRDALASYRLVYPTESSLASDYSTYEDDPNNENTNAEDEDDKYLFTENEYDLLSYYIDQNRLKLYRKYYDVNVSDSGVVLVIQPIAITDYDVEGDYENTMICFGYVPLVLMIDGQSPSLNMGFSDVLYPADFTPALRLGLSQLKRATKIAKEKTADDGGDTPGETPEAEDDEEYTPITVNLRDASYVVEETEDEDGDEGEDEEDDEDPEEGDNPEDEEEQQVVDHLGRINEIVEGDSVDYAKLYLVASNDSDYLKIIEAENFGMYELAVGEIKRLYANEDSSVSDTYDDGAPTDSENNGIGSYMQVYFYDHIGDSIEGVPFDPKEGCYYSMMVHFEEKDEDDSTIATPCYGSFPLELKVVPEYLVWQGTKGTENWNDDNNWRRADSCDIKKTDGTYLTNKANKGNGGYVPMLFTKVVLPKDSKAELYMAGFDMTAPDTVYTWKKEDEKPTNIYPIGDNIMYDMMVYNESRENSTEGKPDTLLTTKRYRVNLCDEIHIEPGAQLAHSEQLMYNRAWIDVSIPKSSWTLVSLPLKDIYAGDWYTKQSGKETSEYFTDLTFDNETESRSNPLVYQRSWDNSASIIEVNEDNRSISETTTFNSYSETGWSSVYNNGAVPYAAGSGFSVKAYLQSGVENDGSVLFRFPKSDVDYTTTYMGDLDKSNSGRLWVSDFVKRTVDKPDDDGSEKIYVKDKDTIRVSYSLTNEGYCLVGNPFTANLSINKFLEVNDSCISACWIGISEGSVTVTRDENSEGTVEDNPVSPYGAFYAVVRDDTIKSVLEQGFVELKFTKDMQTLDTLETETEQVAFSIRAVSASGRSSAAFAYSDNATDGYSVNEDAILLEDDSWKRIGMPLVYTVAGSKAVSVNTLKEQRVIPLGVFADEGSVYTLTFVGVDNVEQPVLYDAELNTETPINEGMSMTLQGATHGRYFIRTAGNATEIQEVTEQKASVSVYSLASRTIVVSADEEIERVEVYSINGSLLKRATVNGSACTITDVNCGIAVVKVKTESGLHVSKLRIKN